MVLGKSVEEKYRVGMKKAQESQEEGGRLGGRGGGILHGNINKKWDHKQDSE
jgi:hypothetical protein